MTSPTVTPTYNSWRAMHGRCRNATNSSYKFYGGRGISVCDRWKRFTVFLADMGERPEGTTLDRIDSNGNYEPANCRWATSAEQGLNKRRAACGIGLILHEGELRSANSLGREFDLGKNTLARRVRRGMSVVDALRMPNGKATGLKARLSSADAMDIRRKHAMGTPSRSLADEFGVNRTTVNRIVAGVLHRGVK